jgi:hypothetical protein
MRASPNYLYPMNALVVFNLWAALILPSNVTYGGMKVQKETISGLGLKIIQAAVPEAEKRGVDLSKYRISVVEDQTVQDGKPTHFFVVSFIDQTASDKPGVGNPGKLPGLEVKLDPNTLSVMKAYFIK